jgi:hypothetical protein
MGAVLSTTVTLNEQVLLLLLASVNVYVTVVVPTGKVAPGLWVELPVIMPGQLSVAVGSIQVAVWSQVVRPGPVNMVWSWGQPAITGAVLSTTVIVKEQGVLLLLASVNVYVTVVVPTGKVAPGIWLELDVTGPQLSVAVGGVQVAVWSQVVRPGPVNMVWLPGQPLTTGAVLSTTVIVNEQGVLLLLPSVNV